MSDLPKNSDADKLQGMEHEKQYDYQLPENYFFKSEKGLTKRIVERIAGTFVLFRPSSFNNIVRCCICFALVFEGEVSKTSCFHVF